MPPKKRADAEDGGPRGPSAFKKVAVEQRQNGHKKSAEYSISNKEDKEVRHYKINQSDAEAKTSQSETGLSINKADWNVREYDNQPDKEVAMQEKNVPYGEKTPKYIFRGFDIDVGKFGGTLSCVECGAAVAVGQQCVCGAAQAQGGRRRRRKGSSKKAKSKGKKRSSKGKKRSSKGKKRSSKGRRRT